MTVLSTLVFKVDVVWMASILCAGWMNWIYYVDLKDFRIFLFFAFSFSDVKKDEEEGLWSSFYTCDSFRLFFLSSNIRTACFADRFGTQPDKSGFRALALPFIGVQTVVFLFTMSMLWSPLIIWTTGGMSSWFRQLLLSVWQFQELLYLLLLHSFLIIDAFEYSTHTIVLPNPIKLRSPTPTRILCSVLVLAVSGKSIGSRKLPFCCSWQQGGRRWWQQSSG